MLLNVLKDSSPRLSAAEDLLAAVVASRWNKMQLAKVTEYLDSCTKSEWQRCVTYHGLAGVLCLYHQEALSRLPAEFTEVIEQVRQRQSLHALKQFATLRDVGQILQQAAIVYMPLKGLLLSKRLYGDIATRASCDIDVLIDPTDFDSAHSALHNAGYTPTFAYDGNSLVRLSMMRTAHHLCYLSEDGQLVELHWRNEPSHSLSLAPLKLLAKTLDVTTFVGAEIPEQTEPLLLSTISMHAARSFCYGWKWGYDVLHLMFPPGSEWTEKSEASNVNTAELCLQVMLHQLGDQTIPSSTLAVRISNAGSAIRARDVGASHKTSGLQHVTAIANESWLSGALESSFFKRAYYTYGVLSGSMPSSLRLAYVFAIFPPAKVVYKLSRAVFKIVGVISMRPQKPSQKNK
ncbi:MAG: hypothetical protein ACI955_002669 [Zhongshania sp.]|jgi:hypothetical protein